MAKLFSPDSWIMRFLDRLGDLLILNLVYLLTCLPFFTIGAASTALYDVCFRLGTDRESSLIRSYFLAFRNNFKQATLLWLVDLFLCTDLSLVLFFSFARKGLFLFLAFIALLLLLFIMMTMGYLFPLISRFYNSSWQILKNAVLFTIAYLPATFVITVLNLIPIILFLFFPATFLRIGFLWLTLYFGVTAYISSRLLTKIFSNYVSSGNS